MENIKSAMMYSKNNKLRNNEKSRKNQVIGHLHYILYNKRRISELLITDGKSEAMQSRRRQRENRMDSLADQLCTVHRESNVCNICN